MSADRAELIDLIRKMDRILDHGETCDCLQCYDYWPIMDDVKKILAAEPVEITDVE
jgi:hypothetical protein